VSNQCSDGTGTMICIIPRQTGGGGGDVERSLVLSPANGNEPSPAPAAAPASSHRFRPVSRVLCLVCGFSFNNKLSTPLSRLG
jgi:hypothetical protein